MTDRALLVAAVLTAGVIGATAWQGPFWLVATAASVPILAFTQPRRAACFAVMAAYYATASWEMVPVLQAGPWLDGSYTLSVFVFTLAILVLTSPWTVLWTAEPKWKPIRTIFALVVSVIPPVGLVGWASPVMAAGVLFPGMKWTGFAISMLIPALLLTPIRITAATALAATSLVANAVYMPAPPIPGWTAVNMPHAQATDEFTQLAQNLNAISHALPDKPNQVLIYPESTIPRWNKATKLYADSVARILAQEQRLALVGTTFPIPGSSEQHNGAVLLGTEGYEVKYTQRVPVPMAMWNPFKQDGFRPCLNCPGTVRIANHRAAVLVCYEQLLPWTLLHSTLESPTILLGMSSSEWARQTSIPEAQALCLRTWGRLFRLPVLLATKE
jgi:hypothetical protein